MRYMKVLFLLVSVFAAGNTFAQTVQEPYEVGVWHGFRNAAVSFTFDDGCSNQFAVAIPLFNEFGFRLTLFTLTRTDWAGLPDWTVLNNAAAQGHEVAAHSLSHTTFAGMSEADQMKELSECQNDINSHIPGNQCITFAYPYCALGNKSLVADYYLAARICSGVIEPKTPRDFMAISSIVCGTEGSVKTADHFLSRAGSAIRTNGWCIYLLHGIDNDGGWSPVTSEVLRETCQLFHEQQNDFWVDTFGNVSRYIKERDDVSVAELSADDSTIVVQITDTLSDTLFNHALTFRRPLPAGWIAAVAAQNDSPVVSQIKAINFIPHIQFDAVPDGGDVVISRRSEVRVYEQTFPIPVKPVLTQNFPNPFNPGTTISFELSQSGRVSLTVFDLLGREIKALVDQDLAAGVHSVVFRPENIAGGMYLYRLQGEGFLLQRKMLFLP
ncbi:MAG: polysaccharide deacetylase family protein [Spirochaetales bacterium]|nr:polysaccharide deacetylase family protein [Spirochaetales bacterium]